MTGLTATFTPGTELRCAVCEFRLGDLTCPSCLIAIEMADDGERMSPACCPMLDDVGKFGGVNYKDPCPICGATGGGCPTCLAELRCDS
jgi:hypothetical protein